MIIVEKLPVDCAGRIALRSFSGADLSKEVGVAFDCDEGEIIIVPWNDDCMYAHRNIDSKRRIEIKSFLPLFVGDIYLVVDEEGKQKLWVFGPDYFPLHPRANSAS